MTTKIRILLAEDQAMVRGALTALLNLEEDLEVVAEVSQGDQVALPACRIVILTTFGRSGYLRRAMESGAVGFLLKDAPAEQLAIAIRRVMAGERVVAPELALAALSDGDNPLTGRERDVLKASLDGTSVADIAAQLYLSEGTVRNHISTAIQKLNVHNRMEAAHLAKERGWL